MDPELVVKNNLKFYDNIKPKQPADTYTVVSTLNDYETGNLLVLATGTQACNRVYTDDIEDCHAESLVKRGLKRYILDSEMVKRGDDSRTCINDTLMDNCEKKSPINLTLFISQFPCGLLKRYEGDEPLNPDTGEIIKRKPGRGRFTADKSMIYVEKDCCLDKIKRWLSYGMQGRKFAANADFVTFQIKQILIGKCEPDESMDYSHCIDLMKHYLQDGSRTPVPILQVVSIHREEFVFRSNKRPQPISMVWWKRTSAMSNLCNDFNNVTIDSGCFEYIVDGRRRGLTKRQCARSSESVKLKISNQLIRRDLDNLLNLKSKSPLL